MSQTLRDARRYEEITEKRIEAEEKPGFHLAARVGWMNDPNGFSFYGGEYHLFYQYHPYNSHWGPMHWGHAVSDDLLHWTYLPAALAPDTIYDEAGCFSGSAVELSNGRQLLMYTGVHKEVQADGGLREVQTQCIAIGDGRDYEKYQGNPVLDEKDLPDGGSKYDFRDPKMWKAPDGTFRCVVGNCAAERDGQILLFSSRDGLDWKYEKVLAVNHGRFGKAWECPDFFELDGKQVLLTSPMDMLPKGFSSSRGRTDSSMSIFLPWIPSNFVSPEKVTFSCFTSFPRRFSSSRIGFWSSLPSTTESSRGRLICPNHGCSGECRLQVSQFCIQPTMILLPSGARRV